jgi:hypothetical protein
MTEGNDGVFVPPKAISGEADQWRELVWAMGFSAIVVGLLFQHLLFFANHPLLCLVGTSIILVGLMGRNRFVLGKKIYEVQKFMVHMRAGLVNLDSGISGVSA